MRIDDARPLGIWAKLQRDTKGAVTDWHPLVAHCADVAAVCESLLTQTILGARLAAIAGIDVLSEQQNARLTVFAFWHDLGKVNHGFQARSDEKAPLVGHVRESLCLLKADELKLKFEQALKLEQVLTWFSSESSMQSLLRASIAHHGRPQDCKKLERWIWKEKAGRDPMRDIASMQKASAFYFPLAWEQGGSALPDKPAFHHAFAGLLMLADWIGSDNARFFPFAKSWPDRSYFARARQQAKQAIEALGLDSRASRHSMQAGPVRFAEIAPYPEPRPLQQAVLDLPVVSGGEITILEAETGAGKTEAALLRFVALYKAGKVDGLYFALPTRTAATQIFERVVAASQRAFPDAETRPAVIMAVPGYLRVDDKIGQHLPDFKVQWHDDPRQYYANKAWAAEHPKRYLAGSIVVGTIDQVLLSALAVDHAHLRAAALLRHLLVVDEVHASDAYMTGILRAVLQRHLSAGGYAFLMSATLGAEVRQSLLDPGSERKASLPIAACQKQSYPLLWTKNQQNQGVESHAIAADEPNKTVAIDLSLHMEQTQEIARTALDAAAKGAKVIILRNTVVACLQSQQALESEAELRGPSQLLHTLKAQPVPHHSRYAQQDRKLLDKALEAHFGKMRPDGGRVAVATQTVQQSLDLDADLLITDLCPMDVLLQRIGRLHRHQRLRPQGFEQARCLVLCPQERELAQYINAKSGEAHGPKGTGLGSVYADLRVIAATWKRLEKQPVLNIPADNRALVEATLHSQALAAVIDSLDPLWQMHASHIAGVQMASKQTAHFNLANWEFDFTAQDVLFPEHSEKKISTRLGLDDRSIQFAEALMGPFGQKIREVNVPSRQLGEIELDATANVVSQSQNQIIFTFGNKRFVYDRLGLRDDG